MCFSPDGRNKKIKIDSRSVNHLSRNLKTTRLGGIPDDWDLLCNQSSFCLLFSHDKVNADPHLPNLESVCVLFSLPF